MNKSLLKYSAYLLPFILIFEVSCSTTEPQYAGTALFPPIQTPRQATPVKLGRVSWIYGDHDTVQGLDVGMVGNVVNKDFKGSALSGVFHKTNGKAEFEIVQVSGLVNINSGTAVVNGLQVAALANLGSKTKIRGFQIGSYNEADTIYGIQIGIINRTKQLYGLQIGLANFSSGNGLPFCPILNAGF